MPLPPLTSPQLIPPRSSGPSDAPHSPSPRKSLPLLQDLHMPLTPILFPLTLPLLQDLLMPTSIDLTLNEDPVRGMVVQGITEYGADSADEILELLHRGETDQTVLFSPPYRFETAPYSSPSALNPPFLLPCLEETAPRVTPLSAHGRDALLRQSVSHGGANGCEPGVLSLTCGAAGDHRAVGGHRARYRQREGGQALDGRPGGVGAGEQDG